MNKSIIIFLLLVRVFAISPDDKRPKYRVFDVPSDEYMARMAINHYYHGDSLTWDDMSKYLMVMTYKNNTSDYKFHIVYDSLNNNTHMLFQNSLQCFSELDWLKKLSNSSD